MVFSALPWRRQLVLQVKRKNITNTPSQDFQFASAVAEFGMLLRNSPWKGNASYARVIFRASQSLGQNRSGQRSEFIDIVQKAQQLDHRTNPVIYRHQAPVYEPRILEPSLNFKGE